MGFRVAALAVALVLVLRPADVTEQLSRLLPNNTRVWALWRETVAERVASGKLEFLGGDMPVLAGFNVDERKLFHTLLGDAQAAVNMVTNMDGYSNKYLW